MAELGAGMTTKHPLMREDCPTCDLPDDAMSPAEWSGHFLAHDRSELADALEALLSPSVSTASVENARELLRRVRGETKKAKAADGEAGD